MENQKKFSLNQEDQELLEAVEQTGRSWQEVLRSILRKSMPEAEIARKQKVGILKLIKDLDAMPDNSPDDGVCASVDHDRILYGSDL